jgi:hypothetical protein
MSRNPLYSAGHVQLPNRVLLLCSPCVSRHQVPCSASQVVPGAHRVVGPGTHQGSGPREVHTTGWAWVGRPKPAGLAHFQRRFSPPFLSPEGSSTLSSWRRHHSQYRESFTARGHPQARGGGGRSPEEDHPTLRKHPQVEKKEATVGSVTMINGAMSSTLMG